MGVNLKYNCEGKITGGSEITIDTQNVWQHITNITEGENCNGLDVEAGVTKSITDTADNGSGKLRITATAHGVGDGDYVSLSGMGDSAHNGLSQVTYIDENTLDCIDITYNSDDDTGTLRHGTHVVIPAGAGGDYVYIASVSAIVATANTTFEFTFILGNTTNGISRRKFATSTDVGNVSMVGFFRANSGGHVSVALRNITSSANITIAEAQFVIFKVS
jgi:hypothetical protein